jgi:hypothetical protein
MLPLTNFEDSRRKCWCAMVVLLAVSALTVSVATRYTFSDGASDRTTILQKRSAPEPARQRLLKNAATWMPPVVCAAVRQLPRCYPRVALSGPPIPSMFFEQSLYNRPPPFLNLLSL